MDVSDARAAFFAYADNYLVDVKFGVIVDVEATRAIRQAEVDAAKTMIDRTEQRLGLKPQRLAADSAYGSAPTLNWIVNDGETLLYMASMRHCRSCPLKAHCCPKAPFRRVPRSIYEDARDVARALAKTEAFERSRHDRKRVEMLFAHLKRILRLGRLRL